MQVAGNIKGKVVASYCCPAQLLHVLGSAGELLEMGAHTALVVDIEGRFRGALVAHGSRPSDLDTAGTELVDDFE